ncbi:MAG: ABC transporter ATP-binding protein [Acidiphilium sp.]|jgi:oligopeptide/dipeptide ABC transporter ATP-binding protein
MSNLLEVRDLTKHYTSRHGFAGKRVVRAVNGVSLDIAPGEALGLVGESGCGKSTLGRCIARLYNVTGGTVTFDGVNITRLGGRALRPIRAGLQMIFQDPYASLNPRRRVGEIIAEPLHVHHRGNAASMTARVASLLSDVGLGPEALSRFPHEFSGGQRQRIGIARALALDPKLIIADEPVSALDVSVQAQIVNLLADLQRDRGLAYLFIAHDLGVVRQIADRVAVMYLGGIVEIGPVASVFGNPAHPYTRALLDAVPVADPALTHRNRIRLAGDPPNPANPPSGCAFHPRCAWATDECRAVKPVRRMLDDGREVACHHPLAAQVEAQQA